MNTDKITSWLGLAQAIGVAAIGFYTTANADGSVDWSSPVFWMGMAVSVLMAAKAWFTNKPSEPSK